MQYPTILATLVASAFTSPLLVERQQSTGALNNASFDDIVITDPLLTYMPMPIYQGLQWQNALAVLLGGGSQANGKPAAGVQPHSGSQVAVFKPQPGPLIPSSASATITKTFPGGTLDSFDLAEFWFGCALTSPQSLVAAVQACTVDVTGYKVGVGGAAPPPPAMKSFVFYGDGYAVSKLGYANATGAGFEGLEKVVITRRTVGPLDQATEAVVLDDVVTVQR